MYVLSPPVLSLSTSVAVAVAEVWPVAVEVNTALPEVWSASSAAEILTVWAVFQFDGVKVSDAPAEAVRSVSPLVLAVATVTFAVGARESLTDRFAFEPSATASVAGVTTTAGVVEVPVTVIPTGAEVVVAPLSSVALAVIE